MKNQIHTVTIDGYSSQAQGVCHIGGRAVFVPKAIPGERWQIRILKVTSSAVYAKGEELLSPSPSRVEPGCPCFGKCGGCDSWHMSYEEELRFKLQRVNDAFARIGGLNFKAEEILPSDSQIRYRNKGIFNFAQGVEGPVCGFYRERSHELVPVERCLIQQELAERCAVTVRDLLREFRLPAYDESSGKGTVRHVFCRKGISSGEAVLCIVSAKGFGDKTSLFVDRILARCPELTGIVLNINKTRGNTVLSGEFYTLWGKADLRDQLCGFSFDIAPQAFFQINPPQAEKLYRKAIEYACPEGTGLALDLYCGAGTISLCLAQKAEKVIGAEIVPQAVENARENARRNGVENLSFICADAGQAAQALAEQGLKPDVIVVDPPRKGMDLAAIEAIAAMSPQRLTYVSCDPATLARDLALLAPHGYRPIKATAVDMFPKTSHVETLVLMTKAHK